MGCNTCFEDYVAKCNDTITIYGQLASLPLYESYTWVITDKFDRKYEGSFQVDENGFWEIPVTQLPDGLLTEYSGSFKLEAFDEGCKPVKFKIAQEYDCISFGVKAGTFTKDFLGCNFNCVPNPAGQSALYPFTAQSEVTINWAPYLALYGNSPVIQVYHLISGTTYQLVDVAVQQVFTDGILTSIIIDNAGVATGYVVIS